ncbi:MAG: 16S ribosomal RNA methyltransferase A [Methanoregulaceae archaeon]|nr:16S ribosomal RNA methyltransferase A [Methanoregulaceae archaeon]
MKPLRDQHFLIDERAIERIASVTRVMGKRVLEIGPGTGNLTRALLQKGATVIAVELDPELCSVLQSTFPDEIAAGTLILLHGDALRCELPPFDMVVSNLPYSASSPITFRLLKIGFTEAVLMYQSEFARRMIARPGTEEYGRLSIMVQTYASVTPCFELSPNAFSPKPQVRSMVVRIVLRSPPYPLRDPKGYAEIVRALFSHRRKTVRNGLRSAIGALGNERVDRILAHTAPELLALRPEKLSLEDFAMLANL